MNQEQWERLLAVLDGETVDPLPVGFIIDSPWLPNWSGISILDYFANDTKWFEANLRAVERFPEIMFLPGFWSEYGMCTEPSAFGAKCLFYENDFPFAEKIMESAADVVKLKTPNPKTDGLAPFVLKRLEHAQAAMAEKGYNLRFAVARGPLNIAAFLMGSTEFLMGLRMFPDETHALLKTITDYLVSWVQLQASIFPTIDGVLFLDDIVGFVSGEDFEAFGKPYLKQIFNAIDAKVRFFHNDALGIPCAPHLDDIGVNLFNFSHDHPIAEMQAAVGENVSLLGNIPPRDILAQGTPEDVERSVQELKASLKTNQRVILSCGGGMPPEVPTENIEAFLRAAGH
jgi:uroporphyrinogen-III decarboxylase